MQIITSQDCLTGFEPHHSDTNLGMLFSLFSTVSFAGFLQKLSALYTSNQVKPNTLFKIPIGLSTGLSTPLGPQAFHSVKSQFKLFCELLCKMQGAKTRRWLNWNTIRREQTHRNASCARWTTPKGLDGNSVRPGISTIRRFAKQNCGDQVPWMAFIPWYNSGKCQVR